MHLALNSLAFSWPWPHPLATYARNDPLARLMRAHQGPFLFPYFFPKEEFLARVVYTQPRKLCHHKTLQEINVTLSNPAGRTFEPDNSRQRQMTISVVLLKPVRGTVCTLCAN